MAIGLFSMQHWGHGSIIICWHDDSGLTFAYCMARSNLAAYAFVWAKVKTTYFVEIIINFAMKLASKGHNNRRYLLTFLSKRLFVPAPELCPSVVLTLQTSCSLKVVIRLKPNCMWNGKWLALSGSQDQDGRHTHIW